MERNFLHNKVKFLFQAGIILLILVLIVLGSLGIKQSTDYEAVCPFGGVLSLGSKLWRGTMSCAMSETQVFLGLMLIVSVILFGKLFCGYLCPVGTISEWLGKLISRVKEPIVLRGILDRILRIGKYVLLFFTAYYTITKSELWCKRFDPYYATVTGFGSDTVLWAGILTIGAVVLGSIFIRYFWCKYVCPLNALSNIFNNVIVVVPIFLVYIVLVLLGVKLNVIWLIGALCLTGAFVEIWRYKFFNLNVAKITRNVESCTQCINCDAACPQGIRVSEYTKVDHPDCTLCLDCVNACANGSLTVGKTKGKWLPPTALVLLVALGFILASLFEFKTLSERWGGYDTLKTVASMKMTLKNVKCYGSSKSLANKLVRVKGIVGLDTYAKTHKVVVYYDESKLNPVDIKKAVFTPSRYKLRKFKNYQPGIIVAYDLPTNGLWDLRDNVNLLRLLMQDTNIVGLETNFGEPVIARIYFEQGRVTPERIVELVEQKYYERKLPNGKVEKIKINFKVEGKGAFVDTVDYVTFRRNFFSGFDQKYNDYEKYSPQDLFIFEVGMPDAESIGVRRALKYLTSHVSEFDGTVRLRTTFTDRPVVQIFFDKKQVKPEQIWAKLLEKELKVFTTEGEVKKMANEFHFEGPYKVYPYNPAMETKPHSYYSGEITE